MDRRSFLKSIAAAMAAASLPVSSQTLEAAFPAPAFPMEGWYRISQHVEGGKVLWSAITKVGDVLDGRVKFAGEAVRSKDDLFGILPEIAKSVADLPSNYTTSCFIKLAPDSMNVSLYGAQIEGEDDFPTNFVASGC